MRGAMGGLRAASGGVMRGAMGRLTHDDRAPVHEPALLVWAWEYLMKGLGRVRGRRCGDRGPTLLGQLAGYAQSPGVGGETSP